MVLKELRKLATPNIYVTKSCLHLCIKNWGNSGMMLLRHLLASSIKYKEKGNNWRWNIRDS